MNMTDNFFLLGCLIGFAIAMPVGPIGMLCIRHSLLRGMTAGLISGLGAALADAFYGAIAGCGITSISDLLVKHSIWIQLIGGSFLLYLGAATFFSSPAEKEEAVKEMKYSRIFSTTFFLTLTNPMTIISFAGIYAGLGVGLEGLHVSSILFLIAGVLTGSAIWWLILSFGCSLCGKRLPRHCYLLINKISGVSLLSFGVLASLSVLKEIFL
jgi:threonine/homoserine/homoserine lactone efflux protein